MAAIRDPPMLQPVFTPKKMLMTMMTAPSAAPIATARTVSWSSPGSG